LYGEREFDLIAGKGTAQARVKLEKRRLDEGINYMKIHRNVAMGIMAFAMLCGTATARTVRVDLFSGSPWTQQSSVSYDSGVSFGTAGITGSDTLLEYTGGNITDLQGGDATNIYTDDSGNWPDDMTTPPLPGDALTFSKGEMYNWVSNTSDPTHSIVAQVTVLTTTDLGNLNSSLPDAIGNVLCDSADANLGGGSSCGYVTSGAKITEIQFNFPNSACTFGGSLNFHGNIYKNTGTGVPSGQSSCDDTFVFLDNSLYGAVPQGWTVETSAVPEPSTYALMLCGLTAILIVKRRAGPFGRRAELPYPSLAVV
jgi:hypothetical protein